MKYFRTRGLKTLVRKYLCASRPIFLGPSVIKYSPFVFNVHVSIKNRYRVSKWICNIWIKSKIKTELNMIGSVRWILIGLLPDIVSKSKSTYFQFESVSPINVRHSEMVKLLALKEFSMSLSDPGRSQKSCFLFLVRSLMI